MDQGKLISIFFYFSNATYVISYIFLIQGQRRYCRDFLRSKGRKWTQLNPLKKFLAFLSSLRYRKLLLSVKLKCVCFVIGFWNKVLLLQDQINMSEVKYPLQHFKVWDGIWFMSQHNIQMCLVLSMSFLWKPYQQVTKFFFFLLSDIQWIFHKGVETWCETNCLYESWWCCCMRCWLSVNGIPVSGG